KFSQHVAGSGIDVGLVERDPELAQVPERLHHAAREALEKGRGLGMKKRAFLFEPARVGEVMQAYHGTNPALHQPLQQLAVTLERCEVPLAFLRLDAAPLDRKAQGVDAQ